MLALARREYWDEVRLVASGWKPSAKHVRTATKLAMAAGQAETVKALAPPDNATATTARRVGLAFEHAELWHEAAAAYYQALDDTPDNEKLRRRFERMRHKAPRWGFSTPASQPAWNLAEYPSAPTTGVVAPVGQGYVVGWIPAGSATAEIDIKLNGTQVAQTRATSHVTLPDGRPYLEFSREVADLSRYAGDGDVLTVEHDARTLPIIGAGKAHTFTSGPSRSGELLELLRAGYVLNKYGKLQKSVTIDHEWQAEILNLYERLKKDVADDMGLTLFPIYGTLLGAVRENNFIGHDNDFDAIYVSEHSEPAAVRAEFVRLCQALVKRGYQLHFTKTHVWVRLPGSTSNRRKIDIFFAWFNTKDELQVSYGYHGPAARKSAEFYTFRQERLGDWYVPVPAAAEPILVQLFGPAWRTPDPGFSHHSETRIVDREYWLTQTEINKLHWDQFYRDNALRDPSPFAIEVSRQFDEPGTIIELGCGSGRDSAYFASQGWQVWAGDRSPEAIQRARQANGNATANNLIFLSVDASSVDELTDLLKRAQDGAAAHKELVAYMRFFLHAVDERVERTILDTLTTAITRDFRFCAEFRTVEDRRLPKTHGQHYRRYIDAATFATRLGTVWGFEIDSMDEGQGLSPFGDEDPYLCRIIAHRPPLTQPQRPALRRWLLGSRAPPGGRDGVGKLQVNVTWTTLDL